MNIAIRNAATLTDNAYILYKRSLGTAWPLSFQRLTQVGTQQVIEAVVDDRPAGFALVDVRGESGYLQLIAVAPEAQGRGVGTRLLAAAEQWLGQHGVGQVCIGRGQGYLWQGAPEGCEHWFARRGYLDAETSIDMTMNLHEYAHPSWVEARLPADVVMRHALPCDAAGLAQALQDDDLAPWQEYYGRLMHSHRHDEILVAVRGEDVVGFVGVLTGGLTWQTCFPGRTGGLACLGVRSNDREKGIGRALAARATLELQALGLDTAYIGWTWLEDWYGALGYRTWRRFHMMSKRL